MIDQDLYAMAERNNENNVFKSDEKLFVYTKEIKNPKYIIQLPLSYSNKSQQDLEDLSYTLMENFTVGNQKAKARSRDLYKITHINFQLMQITFERKKVEEHIYSKTLNDPCVNCGKPVPLNRNYLCCKQCSREY